MEEPTNNARGRTKTVFVSGGNRGIGWEIVRQLASPPWSFHVFLASRSKEKGETAKKQWMEQQKEPPKGAITVIPLDLDDTASITEAAHLTRNALQETNQEASLDIMIHNAAYITYNFSVREVQQSIHTNYRGTVALTHAMAPLLNPNGGRMIFVSSAVGKTYLVPPSMETRLLAPDLTEQELEQHMSELQAAVERGVYTRPTNSMGGEAYGLGKLGGTTIFPRIVARRYTEKKNSTVFVASCCPAFGGPDTPVWLATPPQAVLVEEGHGSFWEQREVTNASQWESGMITTFARTGKYPLGHEY